MPRIKYHDPVTGEVKYADMVIQSPLPTGTANGDILVWDNDNQVWVVRQPSRLPAEYQEVEYIESTGTQYIDTGYVPKSTTKWELVFQTITGSADLSCRNGRHGGGDGERFSIGAASINSLSFTSSTNSMSVHIGSAFETTVSFTQNIGKTSRDFPYALIKKKVTIDASNMTYDMNDGEWSGTISATLTLANQSHLYLFARSLTDGTFDGCGTQNIYSHKIWENGVKVQDFVPCYRKADGVIGMYDIVNDVFYQNAGTGTFTKGADV